MAVPLLFACHIERVMTTPPLAPYPALRLRRLRQADWGRRLVRETTTWTPNEPDLVGRSPRRRRPRAGAVDARCRALVGGRGGEERREGSQGARHPDHRRIFPHIDAEKKDPEGSAAVDPDGLVCRCR